MEVALHLGVHCTDEERLLLALLKNRSALTDMGTALPSSRAYRQMLPRLVRTLRGSPAGGDVQAMVRDALVGEMDARRVVLSHENLACFISNTVNANGLYPFLHQRIAALANVFPADDCTFYVGIRNPASLVPELMARMGVKDPAAHLGDTDPADLRWGPVLKRMLEAVPDARMVFWCNEDTPLLWPDILHAVAGIHGGEPLEGEDDMLMMLLTDEGLTALHDRLSAMTGPFTKADRHDITAEFLERYAKPEEMERTIDLAGWTDDLVEEMTLAYDEDVAEIAALPGVEFLLP